MVAAGGRGVNFRITPLALLPQLELKKSVSY
jgi:hypothetical protein